MRRNVVEVYQQCGQTLTAIAQLSFWNLVMVPRKLLTLFVTNYFWLFHSFEWGAQDLMESVAVFSSEHSLDVQKLSMARTGAD
jgi:hypothetical protein